MKVADIIMAALRGRILTMKELQDALQRLNALLRSWGAK